MNLKDKALIVIEAMLSEGFASDLEYDVAMTREDNPKLITASKVFCTIYEYVHVARGRCKNPHTDWAKDLNKTYNKMKKGGLI